MLAQALKSHLAKMGEAGLYFILGLVILLLARIVWNWITRYNVNHEIGILDNVSAGIAEFGFLIAMAVIIAAAVAGERGQISIYADLLISLLYSLFGLIALALGKVILEIFTPFQLDAEINRDKNQAAGWLQSGFFIAIAIIISGVL
jgi:uncharacterized membrane protein YjfL (UPF0719 family)